MRGARWLLLVAIAVIVGGIGLTYRAQKRIAREAAPPRPKDLPENVQADSECWEFTETDAKNHNRVTARITAVDMREVQGASRTELNTVTLRLPSRKGDSYNLVKCAEATFFKADHRLYCDAATRLILDVPGSVQPRGAEDCRADVQAEAAEALNRAGTPERKLVTIDTSGLTLDTDNHRADTDRPSTFTFERGSGQATGATYDPETHQLQMKSDVEIHYQPDSPHAQPMVIQAGGLLYREDHSDISLSPWGRLIRDTMTVEGQDPVIQLQNHQQIRAVHALHAHGTDDLPERGLQYAADELWMNFNQRGEVEKITGDGHAHLVSTAAIAETTVNAAHVDLNFEVRDHESLLTRVAATGQGVVTSRPLPIAGRELAETETLKSDNLEMQMRPGGREIGQIVTHGRGDLEFLPNQPVQHHRVLTGNNLRIVYGAQSRIDSFHAVDVHTVTDPNQEERKRNRGPSVTNSKEIAASFDSASHLSSMRQSGDFSYTEGDRQARAQQASLDNGQNVIVLDGQAHMWDSSGSTTADRIRMDQRTGDFEAGGHVNSSRMPDRDPQKNSQMLSSDQPLQAQAGHMVSTNRNRSIHYAGDVLMWQGANRIAADAIDVDREKRNLTADGHVVSHLWEQPKTDSKDARKGAPGGPAVLTVVRAPHLVYNDSTRLAVYSGGVDLVRGKMHVKSKELRAYLAESGADSRLERAFADGAVQIVDTEPDRVRTGTGEHSEYYTGEQKVILTGGRPRFSDNLGNHVEGAKLTYWSDTGRLLSDGPPTQPVQSRILRNHKPN